MEKYAPVIAAKKAYFATVKQPLLQHLQLTKNSSKESIKPIDGGTSIFTMPVILKMEACLTVAMKT
jgi:hypothetical protein